MALRPLAYGYFVATQRMLRKENIITINIENAV
jgi:hypothetical protein